MDHKKVDWKAALMVERWVVQTVAQKVQPMVDLLVVMWVGQLVVM